MRPLRAEGRRITPGPCPSRVRDALRPASDPAEFGSRDGAPVRHPSRESGARAADTHRHQGANNGREIREVKGIRRTVLLCLMIGGTLLVAGQAASAANPVRFGAVLNNNLAPDNAYQGRTCDDILTGGS